MGVVALARGRKEWVEGPNTPRESLTVRIRHYGGW